MAEAKKQTQDCFSGRKSFQCCGSCRLAEVWSQNGDCFCEAVQRPSPWSHDGGLISKWVSSDIYAKTHNLQSLFSLDKYYNIEEHSQNRKKSALKKQFDFFFENLNKTKIKPDWISIQPIATDWIHSFIASISWTRIRTTSMKISNDNGEN